MGTHRGADEDAVAPMRISTGTERNHIYGLYGLHVCVPRNFNAHWPTPDARVPHPRGPGCSRYHRGAILIRVRLSMLALATVNPIVSPIDTSSSTNACERSSSSQSCEQARRARSMCEAVNPIDHKRSKKAIVDRCSARSPAWRVCATCFESFASID